MIVSVGGRHLCLGVHSLDGIDTDDDDGIAHHTFALHASLKGPLMAVREISADIELTSTINVGKRFTLDCVLLIEKARTAEPFSNKDKESRDGRFDVAAKTIVFARRACGRLFPMGVP